MRENGMKRKLQAGQAVIGSVITTPEPFLAEVMGAAHFDFLLIDTEHCPFSVYQLQTVLIALQSTESTLIVRAPWNDPVAVKQILDVGAEGVIFPWVSTRAECEAAVAAAKYPPEGLRGFGPRRAARLSGDAHEYARRANEEIMVLVQIERAEALDRLDEILTTPGLDGIMIGPADLAASLGHLHDMEHQEVDAAIQRVLDGCKQHGVPFGMFTGSAERARKWIGRGGRIATLGGDIWFIDMGIALAKREIASILKG
jgi:2-keto-3-deoxy-L-rhamnonate aldolase RhmA